MVPSILDVWWRWDSLPVRCSVGGRAADPEGPSAGSRISGKQHFTNLGVCGRCRQLKSEEDYERQSARPGARYRHFLADAFRRVPATLVRKVSNHLFGIVKLIGSCWLVGVAKESSQLTTAK